MSGTGWVFGALLGILAIALVIAGATGHAQQLFSGITGKSSTSSGVSGFGQNPTAGMGANLTADQAISSALAGIGAGMPPSTSSGSANPYGGLGPATTTNPGGPV